MWTIDVDIEDSDSTLYNLYIIFIYSSIISCMRGKTWKDLEGYEEKSMQSFAEMDLSD
jgi:hypothetical protein